MARKRRNNKSGSASRNSKSETCEMKSGSNPEPKGNDGKDKESEVETKGANDPAWYARDPQLLVDAASIPFSNVFGAPVKVLPNGDKGLRFKSLSSFKFEDNSNGLPGIVTLFTVPSIGNAENFNDPANVAAHMLYTHVRYNNSGRKNYDQADLMMYCLAISDLYSYIFWLRRIYNCAFVLSQRNVYFGEALLKAQHIDVSITENLAQFRSFINNIIAKVSSLVVPDSIELFKRRAFMYSSIYLDNAEGVIKDQMYMFNPEAFFQYYLDSAGKGGLRRFSITPTSNQHLKLSDLMTIGERLLVNIIGDEDFGIMSGDLMRAFQNSLIGLESQVEEGVIIPVHDPYVLAQFKNATIAGGLVVNAHGYGNFAGYEVDSQYLKPAHFQGTRGGAADGEVQLGTLPTYEIPLSITDPTQTQDAEYGRIYQDGYGNIRSKELVVVGANNYKWNGSANEITPLVASEQVANINSDVIITSERFENDPAYVVEATRLVCRAKGEIINAEEESDYSAYQAIWSGSDIVVRAEVAHANIVTGNYPNWIKDGLQLRATFSNFQSNYALISFHWLQAVTQAKYFPVTAVMTSVFSQNGAPALYIPLTEFLSDLMNYTIQPSDVVERLTEIAMLSLLSVPGVSKVIN